MGYIWCYWKSFHQLLVLFEL